MRFKHAEMIVNGHKSQVQWNSYKHIMSTSGEKQHLMGKHYMR